MREIPVSKGLYTALVSDEDYDRLSAFKWQALKGKRGTIYARRQIYIGYKNGRSAYKTIYMHRDVLATEKLVDHIDGNGLNNQRENLRECNASQNAANARKRYSVPCKGVSFNRNGWQASITVNGKNIYLGRYKTPEEGNAVYMDAAKHYHGEFARER